MLFSTEQLNFLQDSYGINPMDDFVQVVDGVATKRGNIWIKTEYGPNHVSAKANWQDIKANPQNYFINKPKFKVEYLD